MTYITGPDGKQAWVRSKLNLAYVIQGDDDIGSIKVGRSANPDQRVSGLITGLPFKAKLIAVMLDGSRRERELKALLQPYRLQGEWFAPSTALQVYLRKAKAENAIVRKVAVNAEFFRSNVLPIIEGYLDGRKPNYNNHGDLVFRVLHDGYEAFKGREVDLATALAGRLTPEVIAGFMPLGFEESEPSIRLPETEAA